MIEGSGRNFVIRTNLLVLALWWQTLDWEPDPVGAERRD